MRLAKEMLLDETGLVLSAEAVMVGTLGVLGAVVGLSAVSNAVDAEMKEFAGAIRSLDQSYGYMGHQSCRAWSAGSYYRQPDVNQSLSDLCSGTAPDITAIEKQVDAQRRRGGAVQLPEAAPTTETPTVIPNKIQLEPKAEESDQKPKA